MDARKLYAKSNTKWVIFALILPIVICVLTIVSARAFGVSSDRMCTHNPDMTCKWSPAKTARKFRDGYYDKAHGVNLSNYFKQPAKSRAVFVKKAHRKIAHMSPAHRRLVLQWINAHSKVTARGSGDPPSVCNIKDWWCLARASVFTAVKGANCRGGQYYSVSTRSCRNEPPEEHFMTVRQTIAVGGVFFCGGSVVIGVITSPASGGSTAMVAGWGASSCMFSAWAALQD